MMMNYPNYPVSVMPVAGSKQAGTSPFATGVPGAWSKGAGMPGAWSKGAGVPGAWSKGAGLAQKGAYAKYGKPLAPAFGASPGTAATGVPTFGAFTQPDLTPYSKPGWRAE